MPLTILADDLTGACDTGALFGGSGPVAVAVAPGRLDPEHEVWVVDTESRPLAPAAAAHRVRDTLATLPPTRRSGRVFKKIDSSFRGVVGAEVEAVLEATQTPTALICPAFPRQGRTVVQGILLIHGEPVHQGPLGRDPDFRASTSDLVRILEAQMHRRVQGLRLTQVRDHPGELTATVQRMGKTVLVADAETDEDLASLARAVLECVPAPLLVGSAGLAAQVASSLGYATPSVTLPAVSTWFVVAGSFHPATRSQLGVLEARGVHGARLDPLGPAAEKTAAVIATTLKSAQPAFLTAKEPAGSPGLEERRGVALLLARAASAILERATPDLLVLVGGETAVAIYEALKADLIEVDGAPRPGLALGRLKGGLADGIPVLTKAGGFGTPDLFPSLFRV